MRQSIFVLALLYSLATLSKIAADETSYFRSDQGVAADDAQPLPSEFDSKQGYLWRSELPPGNSTPCVCSDRIFVTTFREKEKQLATVALDRNDGEILWERVVPTNEIEDYHPVGSPASSTPACDGERVYAFFGSYGLLCYDLEGNLLWSKRLGPFQDEFGASSSPILVDDKVILNEDHDVDSFVIALDKLKGDVLWKIPRPGFTRSYSTPIVVQNGDSKQLIVAGALQLTSYNLANGEELWRMRGLSRIVDTTPIFSNGLLYLATWTPGGDAGDRISMEPFGEALESYDKNGNGRVDKPELPEGAVLQRFFRIDLNQDLALDEAEWEQHARVFQMAQNVALALRPTGEGDVTESQVQWSYDRGLPVCPSPVVYDGVMYMVKDSGILTALDAQNGKLLKQGRIPGRGNYYASLVAGDGKVYAVSEQGTLSVVQAGDKWDVLSSHDFEQRIIATPVIADGKIYVRTEKALYCFGVK